jgi:hypothetical protein
LPTLKFLVPLLLLITTAALAETTIPLPDLAGEYAYNGAELSAPNERQMEIRFPDDVVGFEGLRMKLTGEWDLRGTYETLREVGGIVYRDTLPFAAGIQLVLTTPGMGDDVFWAREYHPVGSMDGWEEEFAFCCPNRAILPEDAPLLLGRDVTASLTLVGVAEPERVVVEPAGRLDEVLLILDGAVPVEPHSWGALKALFR